MRGSKREYQKKRRREEAEQEREREREREKERTMEGSIRTDAASLKFVLQ